MSPLHIHLDAVGGVAGDMFIAAVCAAFPELRAGMLATLQRAGLPPDVQYWFAEHADHALTGLRFLVHDLQQEAQPRTHVRGRPHHERSFADIRADLLASELEPEVKQRAVAIFALLAEVEGEIHGVPADRVSFHELGGNDSIADIVGAAHLIAALPGTTWTVSALPLGGGRVHTAHGMLPVPAPAAARLLQGFDFVDDGVEGERVTPTGAAILKHLGANPKPGAERGAARTPRRLTRTGHGFGGRTFPALSNVLRALIFEQQSAPGTDDKIALIAFEVDDQSPEDLAIALDHLRAHPGVLDVLQIPAFGKKGRMLAHLQILAEPSAAEDVFEACFNETATLGLRWQVMERRVLARRQRTVQLAGRSVRVKVAERPDARTAKAESDDLLALSGGRAVREQARRAAEDEGLRARDEEERKDRG